MTAIDVAESFRVSARVLIDPDGEVQLHLRCGAESVVVVFDGGGHLDHVCMSRGPGQTYVAGPPDVEVPA